MFDVYLIHASARVLVLVTPRFRVTLGWRMFRHSEKLVISFAPKKSSQFWSFSVIKKQFVVSAYKLSLINVSCGKVF